MLNDEIRGGIPIGIATAVTVVIGMLYPGAGRPDGFQILLITACSAFTAAFFIYLV